MYVNLNEQKSVTEYSRRGARGPKYIDPKTFLLFVSF